MIWRNNSTGTAPRSAESVLETQIDCDWNLLPTRDDAHFVPGQLHGQASEWEVITRDHPMRAEIMDWISNGVSVQKFFRHFKGTFRGATFDAPTPPPFWAPNQPTCQNFNGFIAKTLEERIRSGAVILLGRVGEITPPHLVMPLTVEPSKPRLCYDARFLNLWCKDSHFSLETLKDVPRLVPRADGWCASLDHKSGYDHLLMTKESLPFFGFQFGNFLFCYASLSFGWKESPFVYQTLSSAAVSYLRSLGVSCMAYIDDFFLTGSGEPATKRHVYAMIDVLTRLGYYISSSKSHLSPARDIRFLGLIVDTEARAFRVPEDKRAKMKLLREEILQQNRNRIPIKTLQRWAGKCISLMQAIPEARMLIREVNRTISVATTSGGMITVSSRLADELRRWEFLDTWTECIPWRSERHVTATLATDASLAGYAVVGADGSLLLRDSWKNDPRPIHLKEAEAVQRAVVAMAPQTRNGRLVILVDNKAVVLAWSGLAGSKDRRLNGIMLEILEVTREYNIDLKLSYIPSAQNPADGPSRHMSDNDASLLQTHWARVEEAFGPHSVDGMALPSNAKLPSFIGPVHAPGPAGMDFFAQNLETMGNIYVFPPFAIIAPTLALLREKSLRATIILPEVKPHPSWWPLVKHHSTGALPLGKIGQTGVIEAPGPRGYEPRKLQWDLSAFKVDFREYEV